MVNTSSAGESLQKQVTDKNRRLKNHLLELFAELTADALESASEANAVIFDDLIGIPISEEKSTADASCHDQGAAGSLASSSQTIGENNNCRESGNVSKYLYRSSLFWTS